MKNIEEITMTKGDGEGLIDDLILFLNEAKAKGDTNYSFRWSGDPIWSFKWIETYRIKSEKEILQEAIIKLQQIIELQNRLAEMA